MGLAPDELRLSAQVGDAVARWLKHHHPNNTAKLVARDTGADPRTVENMLAGHLSAQSLQRLLRAYGWPFLSAVGAATIGETYEDSIEREIKEIAHERRQLDEQEQRLRDSHARVRARSAVDRGGLRLVHPQDDEPRREARW